MWRLGNEFTFKLSLQEISDNWRLHWGTSVSPSASTLPVQLTIITLKQSLILMWCRLVKGSGVPLYWTESTTSSKEHRTFSNRCSKKSRAREMMNRDPTAMSSCSIFNDCGAWCLSIVLATTTSGIVASKRKAIIAMRLRMELFLKRAILYAVGVGDGWWMMAGWRRQAMHSDAFVENEI